MHAVKVVLLPPPATPSAQLPLPRRGAGDRDTDLDAVLRYLRGTPRPGIAHVSLARSGSHLVAMTFVEAGSLTEALRLADAGWREWLDGRTPLAGWSVAGRAPDPYLSPTGTAPA